MQARSKGGAIGAAAQGAKLKPSLFFKSLKGLAIT